MTENLATALAAFQAELPSIGKDSKATVPGKDGKQGYTYRYADLASISAVVLPLAAKHGLSFTARPTLDEQGRFVLAYSLRHVGGDHDDGTYPLPAANSPAQQIGSAITYARRYALCAVLGIAPDEDDDGAQAPPASRQPAERHDSSWDPEVQELLRIGWEAEIGKAATSQEIAEIGQKLLKAKRDGEMSPSTYQRLGALGGRRKAELDQAGQEQPLPEATP